MVRSQMPCYNGFIFRVFPALRRRVFFFFALVVVVVLCAVTHHPLSLFAVAQSPEDGDRSAVTGEDELVHLKLTWLSQPTPVTHLAGKRLFDAAAEVPSFSAHYNKERVFQRRRRISAGSKAASTLGGLRRVMSSSSSSEDVHTVEEVVSERNSYDFLSDHSMVSHVSLMGPSVRKAGLRTSATMRAAEDDEKEEDAASLSSSFLVAVPLSSKEAFIRDLEGLYAVEATYPSDHLSDELIEGFQLCRAARDHRSGTALLSNRSITFIFETSVSSLPHIGNSSDYPTTKINYSDNSGAENTRNDGHARRGSSAQCTWWNERRSGRANHGEIYSKRRFKGSGDRIEEATETPRHTSTSLPHASSLTASTAASPFIRATFSNLCDCQPLIFSLAANYGCRHAELTPLFTPQNHIATVTLQSATDSSRPIWSRGLTGKGQLIGVGDTGLDHDSCFFRDDKESVAHYPQINLKHRKLISYVPCVDGGRTDATDGFSAHGTHVAGSVAGSSVNDDSSQHNGMAKDAKLIFHDLTMDKSTDLVLPPDIGDYYAPTWAVGARISSNSWGGAASKGYTFTDKSSDTFLYENQELMSVFAAGNYGTRGVIIPGSGKNVLSVGAHRNSESAAAREEVSSFSARGPTYDGRTKPDLTAPGQVVTSAKSDGNLNTKQCLVEGKQGTSMATPLVSGSAALLRQYLAQGYHPTGLANVTNAMPKPSGPLIKALLIHSTTQMSGQSGPDSTRGFGRLELQHLFNFQDGGNKNPSYVPIDVADWRTVAEADTHELCYSIKGDSAGAEKGAEVKATLVWHDSGAAVEGTKNLPIVNNLDLALVTQDGAVYSGNDFSTNVKRSGSPLKWDRTNNAEQVRLVSSVWASIRNFKVLVHAPQILDGVRYGGQPYAVVVSGPGLVRDVSGRSCEANACPNGCSGIGQCVSGVCHCPSTHHHIDCSQCNGTAICNGRGSCSFDKTCSCANSNIDTSKDKSCGVCKAGWYGPLCDFSCDCAKGTCDTEAGKCMCGNDKKTDTSSPAVSTSAAALDVKLGEGFIGSCYDGRRCDQCCVDHGGEACAYRSRWCLKKQPRKIVLAPGSARSGLIQINGKGRYNNGDACQWTLEVVGDARFKKAIIAVTVKEYFQIENPYDSLTIIAGGRQVSRITGAKPAGTVLYRGEGPVTLDFFADLEGDEKGFILSYSADLPDVETTMATTPTTTTTIATTTTKRPSTTTTSTSAPSSSSPIVTSATSPFTVLPTPSETAVIPPVTCISDISYCTDVASHATCVVPPASSSSPSPSFYCQCDSIRPSGCGTTPEQRLAMARQFGGDISISKVSLSSAAPNMDVVVISSGGDRGEEPFFTTARLVVVFLLPFVLGVVLSQMCNRKIVGALVDEVDMLDDDCSEDYDGNDEGRSGRGGHGEA